MGTFIRFYVEEGPVQYKECQIHEEKSFPNLTE